MKMLTKLAGCVSRRGCRSCCRITQSPMRRTHARGRHRKRAASRFAALAYKPTLGVLKNHVSLKRNACASALIWLLLRMLAPWPRCGAVCVWTGGTLQCVSRE